MKNNSESNEKNQFNTALPPELKRTLKMVSAVTNYSIEALTADAFKMLFGDIDAEFNRRRKKIQKAAKALKPLADDTTTSLWSGAEAVVSQDLAYAT